LNGRTTYKRKSEQMSIILSTILIGITVLDFIIIFYFNV